MNKVARWYCHAEDELADCMARTPQLYDPDEWDHEHDHCGWVVCHVPTGQHMHEDWEKAMARKTRGD